MWNFGIPYALKYYIDAIVQPGYLFQYTPDGAIGESDPRFGPHPIARPGKTRAEDQATEDGHGPNCR